MKHLVYVAGPPAAGKSTLTAGLTAACTRTLTLAPFAHDLLTPPQSPNPGWTGVELGRRRPRYAGTDALPLHIQPAAVAWVAAAAHQLVLAEGDRLANMGFLMAAARAGYRTTLLILDCPGHVLDARCTARGSQQDPAWRAGRVTKTARLAANADATGLPVHHLDARQPPAALLAAAVTAAPALAALQPPTVPTPA